MGVGRVLRAIWTWFPAILGLLREVNDALRALTAHVEGLHTQVHSLGDLVNHLVGVVHEIREDARAELELAEKEKRATDATEARIRRLLAEVKSAGEAAELAEEGGDGEPMRGVPSSGNGAAGHVVRRTGESEADYLRRYARSTPPPW